MTTNVQVVDVRRERREESRCVANEDERGKEQYNGFRELPVHEFLVIALGDQATGYRSNPLHYKLGGLAVILGNILCLIIQVF